MANYKNILVSLVIFSIILSSLYLFSLSQVRVEKIQVNELSSVSLSGFTLSGYVNIKNNGILPVYFNKIEYDIILDYSDEILSHGKIYGTWLMPFSTKPFSFSKFIGWKPSSELAWKLITPRETDVTLNGILYIANLGVVDFKVPFSAKFDIEEYIKQFAKKKIIQAVDNISSAVEETVTSIGNGIKNVAGGIVSGIKGLFN